MYTTIIEVKHIDIIYVNILLVFIKLHFFVYIYYYRNITSFATIFNLFYIYIIAR